MMYLDQSVMQAFNTNLLGPPSNVLNGVLSSPTLNFLLNKHSYLTG
jgi:hypothetical protein